MLEQYISRMRKKVNICDATNGAKGQCSITNSPLGYMVKFPGVHNDLHSSNGHPKRLFEVCNSCRT